MTVTARQLNLWKSKRQLGEELPSPNEFPVHCQIVDTLKVSMMPGWKFWHTPNEGRRSRKKNKKTGKEYSPEAARLARMGVRSGVSDFLFIGPPAAQLHAYELKAKGKKPTKSQLEFGQDVIAAGGKFTWGDGYEHAIEQFKEWGIVRTNITVF